ncbi:hypothetical protein [Pseudorhodoferax sp.]|uniref:hypothetical protein n=1 Tax=Pseudorhodoferax sp. TaxID=1993553 RepID=UPI0039E491D7
MLVLANTCRADATQAGCARAGAEELARVVELAGPGPARRERVADFDHVPLGADRGAGLASLAVRQCADEGGNGVLIHARSCHGAGA